MITRRFRYFFILLAIILVGCNSSHYGNLLPRSAPEAEGVSSGAIIDFLQAASKSRNEFHSFMFLRHGKVIAEGWWNPYRPDLKHSLYSASKSFTSTAVGFAVSEKLLKVDDKVISFFPDELPDSVSPFLSELTVKDLLIMSAGQDPEPTLNIVPDDNWVKAFLAVPIKNKPGTKFLYNTMATFMLSAIVQKVTGQKEFDYLQPRLFEPLGIQGIDWEVSPHGINTGGWGLRLKTEDMAKFGQLYLQKGKWHGKQLLPENWVEEATTKKIDQPPQWIAAGVNKDSSDWTQGYCYQFWRCRHNAFRADGAYGQYIIVMPDQDAVIAITCETPDMQDEINLVWKYLLPGIHTDKLPADPEKDTLLKQKLASLALPVLTVDKLVDLSGEVTDKSFKLDSNDFRVNSIRFHFSHDTCQVQENCDSSRYEFSFGSGSWLYGETNLPGPYLLSTEKDMYAGLPPLKVTGCYRWTEDSTLELILRYIESPHTEMIQCHFTTNKIEVKIHKSFNPAGQWEYIEGEETD